MNHFIACMIDIKRYFAFIRAALPKLVECMTSSERFLFNKNAAFFPTVAPFLWAGTTALDLVALEVHTDLGRLAVCSNIRRVVGTVLPAGSGFGIKVPHKVYWLKDPIAAVEAQHVIVR